MSFTDAVDALSLDPQMWWRLGEASGTAVADASGHGRTGTITGGVTYSQPSITGDGNTAILLNGTNAYIRADAYAPFVIGSKRTFVLLLKREVQAAGIKNIFGGSGTVVPGVSADLKFPVLETSGSAPDRFRYYGSVADQFPAYTDWSGPEPGPGEWFLVALRVDDSLSGLAAVDLSVNGVDCGIPNINFSSLTPSHWNSQAGRFMLGGRFEGAGGLQSNEFHKATYDEVMIFDGLLTNAELVSLAQAVGLVPEPTGTRGFQGDLVWELCDLEQNVLAEITDRRPGAQVAIGRQVARAATLTLDLDDPVAQMASVGDQVLRCSAAGWTDPLFVGRVIQHDIAYDGDAAELKLTAADPLAHLEACLIFGSHAMSPSAETFLALFAAADPSSMMALLIATVADNGTGLVSGALDLGAPDLPLGFPAGSTVADALRSISGLDDMPEFEIAPVLDNTGRLAELNTYWPRQGVDKTGFVSLRLGSGDEDELLGFGVSPSMSGVVNRHVVIGDAPDASIATSSASGSPKQYPLHPAYRASHNGSIARYGVWETAESASGASAADVLQRTAKANVAANIDPVSTFGVTLDPDLAPPFGPQGDFWIGDVVAVEITTPQENQLSYTGRVASATLTEAENGDVLIDLGVEPEDDAVGVSGSALSVVVDSTEGTTPPTATESDPCAPPAPDTAAPLCPSDFTPSSEFGGTIQGKPPSGGDFTAITKKKSKKK